MCFLTQYDWTFKYTGAIGARIRDPETLDKFIIPQFDQEEDEDLADFIEEEYNGVHHSLVGNYYARFFFDNLINIILVMILLNMV